MKFDVDLVREILLRIEQTPANQEAGSVTVPGYDEHTVLEHLELLEEKGLIRATIGRTGGGPTRVFGVIVERLTPKGHEFLANAHNDDVWNLTKQTVKEKGGSASFEVFTALLSQAAMRVFGLD
jgi:predicted ArsR family transcriptional regulator